MRSFPMRVGPVATLVGYAATVSLSLYYGAIYQWTGANAWWIRVVLDTFVFGALAALPSSASCTSRGRGGSTTKRTRSSTPTSEPTPTRTSTVSAEPGPTAGPHRPPEDPLPSGRLTPLRAVAQLG
jgi:hypothetical protein